MIYDKYIESNHVDRPYAIRDMPTHFLWRYIEFRSLGPPYEYYLLKNKFNWDRIVLHYFGKFGRVPHFNVQMSILTSEAAHRSREGKKPVGPINDQIKDCHWEHILEVITGQISKKYWSKELELGFDKFPQAIKIHFTRVDFSLFWDRIEIQVMYIQYMWHRYKLY